MIDVEETEAECMVVLETEATGMCPYDDVVDHYDVTIEYEPDGRIVEMRSLSGWLDRFEDYEISHEMMCDVIFRELDDMLSPESLRVVLQPQEYHGIQATVVCER